ncbi:MAG: rhomboid family intramembrane serine protease [Polyangiaceae bacterium]
MSYGESSQFVLPKPGRALKGLMLALFSIWLSFALALNWANVPQETFLLFAGSTQRILEGQIWRLFTAPLLHAPTVGGIVMVLFGLYFLTPTLEERWGGKRTLWFLGISSVFAYVFQSLLELALGPTLGARLVGEYWLSAVPAIEAIAIAWALTFRGQTVRLFFILPVTSRGLILFVVGMSVLYVITLERPMCGLLSPFGGMIAGYLFGGGTPSPARRAWLSLRLARLEREAARERHSRRRRVEKSGLSVIHGGKDDDDDKPGPDGNLLN